MLVTCTKANQVAAQALVSTFDEVTVEVRSGPANIPWDQKPSEDTCSGVSCSRCEELAQQCCASAPNLQDSQHAQRPAPWPGDIAVAQLHLDA